jgi:hypothetical protein
MSLKLLFWNITYMIILILMIEALNYIITSNIQVKSEHWLLGTFARTFKD